MFVLPENKRKGHTEGKVAKKKVDEESFRTGKILEPEVASPTPIPTQGRVQELSEHALTTSLLRASPSLLPVSVINAMTESNFEERV